MQLKTLKAILAFNKKPTNGMILDLRNNGGGSLRDAVDISGFFIPKGPIVQVSDSSNRKDQYNDKDNQTIYKKPLIILVNTFSASASEIVSAAFTGLWTSHNLGKQTHVWKRNGSKGCRFRQHYSKKQPIRVHKNNHSRIF